MKVNVASILCLIGAIVMLGFGYFGYFFLWVGDFAPNPQATQLGYKYLALVAVAEILFLYGFWHFRRKPKK